MKYLVHVIFLLIFSDALAQKEQYNWYFGRYAALSFETGNAVVKYDNPQNIYGQSASISDPVTGKLLFYTNGLTVWNRLHLIMGNGGGISGGPVGDIYIFPQPGHPGIYYLFFIAGSRLKYTTVDVNGGGGSGMVNEIKELETGLSRQLAVVRHPYTDAYWVIAHQNSSNYFHTFLAGPDSVTTEPVESGGGFTAVNYGDMVPSNKGDKLVVTNYDGNSNYAELFDFDAVCGTVGNARVLPKSDSWDRAYGIAFSDDDSKLYITYSYVESQLVQYSEENYQRNYVIATAPDNFNILRLGPDKRIYISTHDGGVPGPRMDVILNPDELANNCNYRKTYLTLNNGGGQSGAFELPAFARGKQVVSPIKDSIFSFTGACQGDTTFFEFNTTNPFDSLLWHFGDGSIDSLSNKRNPFHIYKNGGRYNISITIYRCGKGYKLGDTLNIKSYPVINFVRDTTICYGKSLVLTGPAADAYLWSTGATTRTIFYDQAGTVWLKASNGKCSNTDSVTNKFHDPIFTALGDEYFICDKEKELVKLDGGEGFVTYKWTPTGDTTQWIIVGDLGNQYLVVKDFRGCDASDGTVVKRRCPVAVYFPDVFTPNNDGLNDSYVPVGADVTSFHMLIYNRWGQLVFETNDIRKTWDGLLKGRPAPADTYIYIAEYSGYVNKIFRQFDSKGNITLLR